MADSRLLAAAARCYVRSGAPLDGARCLERSRDHIGAARLYERARDPGSAGRCYEAGDDLRSAARCHAAAGDVDRAIDCLVSIGERLEAGWLACGEGQLARAHGLFAAAFEADAAHEQAEPPSASARLRRRIGLARCEAASPGQLHAGLERVVLDVEAHVADGREPAEHRQLEQWAVQAADALGRFDLSAQVFAAGYLAGQLGVASRWRAWAMDAFGDATGVPLVDAAPATPEER